MNFLYSTIPNPICVANPICVTIAITITIIVITINIHVMNRFFNGPFLYIRENI